MLHHRLIVSRYPQQVDLLIRLKASRLRTMPISQECYRHRSQSTATLSTDKQINKLHTVLALQNIKQLQEHANNVSHSDQP